MSDLISREDAIEAITNYAKFLWKNYHETCNLAGMIDAIEALPAAERVGKWIKLYAGNYKCSVCGDWWGNDNNEMVEDFKYCPNCGARMDVPDNDVGEMEGVEDE